MYLRGSKWSMSRRRRRPNYFLIVVLLVLIGAMLYINQFVIPEMPSPFVPTPTATRDPESFIAEAEALFNEGKLFQSIEKYQEAVRARSNDASLYVAMARVQVFAGQYEDALSARRMHFC